MKRKVTNEANFKHNLYSEELLTINQNLMVKFLPQLILVTLSTMSAMKNIVAQAEVTERFPQEFAIYDLNEFLSALSLFEEPELNFQDSMLQSHKRVLVKTSSIGSLIQRL